MSSKTRIIVLHMKEIIYTAVFLALAVVLAVVLFFMFGPGKNASHTASEKSRYKPGVYTSSITLNAARTRAPPSGALSTVRAPPWRSASVRQM